jgi:hypothetical protein
MDERPQFPKVCTLHSTANKTSHLQHFIDGAIGGEDVTFSCGCDVSLRYLGPPIGWQLSEVQKVV